MNRGLPGKRVLCLMLAAVLLLSAAACGQGSVLLRCMRRSFL